MTRDPRALARDLGHSTTYREWREVALALDRLEGKDDWRADPRSADYDHELLQNRIDELRGLRVKNDVPELVYWLQEGLHTNIGDLTNAALYGVARAGTKHLIEAYVHEVAQVLNFLCDGDFAEVTFEQKMRFFQRTGRAFGRAALMLSGGGTLGIFHLGLVKALWLQGLLPRVISGSSAGAVVAGIAGCRDDDELPEYFEPENVATEMWATVGLDEVVRHRALMDPGKLEAALTKNLGDRTFVEAFQHSGRIVNIAVSPVRVHQPSLLLSYLTTPTVLVTRGALASCAVPGLFPAVSLLAKAFDGAPVPYQPRLKYADGSLRSDLPMLRLSRLHNVNYTIVSQTNPHVAPFLRAAPRQGSLGAFVSASLRSNGRQVVEALREHVDSEGLGRLLDEVHGVLAQRYRGDITIAPKLGVKQLARLLSNPTRAEVADFILAGERATWPHLERLRVATTISQTLDDCIQRLKVSQGQRPAGPTTVSVPWARPQRGDG